MSTNWLIYILQCADGSLYTGITNDLDGRLNAHNNGRGAKYLRGRLPVHLVYSENAKDRSAATKREYEIKRMDVTGKRKLITHAQMISPLESPVSLASSDGK